jgi:hypothetical protein
MAKQAEHVSPTNAHDARTSGDWTFDIGQSPIGVDEQAVFAADLEHLGLDEGVWDILNGSLHVYSAASRPMVVRAYDGSSLIGLAVFIECKKAGLSFFDPPLSTLMDLPGMPMFVWIRYGTAVDQCANPGFVAEGVDRSNFVAATIRALQRTYLSGSLTEYSDAPALPDAVRSPFIDFGVVDVTDMASLDDYLQRGKNLRRKVKKFHNKGGEVEVIEGSIPPDTRRDAISAFRTMSFIIRTPFQDIYPSMAERAMSLESSSTVHFVARIDGNVVGYQSFCRSGNALHCLSGAFDRNRKSTYHAYENIIIESIRYSLDRRLDRIDYGPILNETKAKMMTAFQPCEIRTYARYRPFARIMPVIIRNSKIAPERVNRYVEIGDAPQELPFL